MATSYSNTGGSGNRAGVITVSNSTSLFASGSVGNLINGNTVENNTGFAARTDGVLTFDFGDGVTKVIDAFKWYQSNNSNHGSWKWQGSQDGSGWSDVGSSFTLDNPPGGGSKEYTTPLSGNLLAYRYWRMVQVSGTCSTSPFVREIEFKIDDGAVATLGGRFVMVG